MTASTIRPADIGVGADPVDGGVRADGNCEVKPDMRCVWLEAYRGSERIPGGVEAMRTVQFAVDHRGQGRSSWLRVAREKSEPKPAPK